MHALDLELRQFVVLLLALVASSVKQTTRAERLAIAQATSD
jgi:hypothetical protein